MTPYDLPGHYLPHEAPMILLEEVISVSEGSAHCRSWISPHSVLGPFLTSQGELPGWYALELMAQTVGVWNGWHNQKNSVVTPALGMILGARELRTTTPYFTANQQLDIEVTLLMQDGRVACFEAAITASKTLLAQGKINTYQPDSTELAQLFKKGNH